jgi:hypothetical protein
MQHFICKRYRRSAPGAVTGTWTDQLRFCASSLLEAETQMRQELLAAWAHMNWKAHFATLEDEDGRILVRWLHGALHA